jgi:hypothetical protein
LGLDIAATGAPFLLSGWVTAACVARAASEARRPYAASLLGGALGCPLALSVTALTGSEAVVFVAAALGLVAAAAFSSRRGAMLLALLAAVGLVGPMVRLPEALRLRLSPYKPLAMARLLPDARTTVSRWSATTRLDIVESQAFHIFPGLSLNARFELPQQVGVFLDGEGPLALASVDPSDPEAASLAAAMPSGLAYALRPGARVLVLRPGAGMEASLALAAGATSVTMVAEEPLVIGALRGPYLEFTHGLVEDPRVHLVAGPQRSGIARLAGGFDLVVLSLSEPYRPIQSGAFSLNEEYGLTVEAFSAALDQLGPDGLLFVTRWLGTPPSDETRAWATMIAALALRDAALPEAQLLAYRSMRTATLVAGLRPFRPGELSTVRGFLEGNGYDPIHLPDVRVEELNRHNRLPRDVYHESFSALLDDSPAALQAAEMDVRPATDNHPFYFQFFRWRQTPEVLAQLGQTWQPLGGSGFLVLLLLLVVLVLLGVGLAALVGILTRRSQPSPQVRPRRFVGYFASIGLGYLLVEVALIQQFGLLLDRPAYSLAAVLAALLLSSGGGSLFSNRARLDRVLPLIAGGVVILAVVIPAVSGWALDWPLAARWGLVAGLVLPLGWAMGIPFARGLQQLQHAGPALVPWAWTANGAASGVAGVIGTLLSLSWGFRATLAAAAATYLLAWLLLPRSRNAGYQSSGTKPTGSS